MVRDEISDPRSGVLQLLRAYAAKYRNDAEETSRAEVIINFVEAYPDCAYRELKVGHLTGSAWIVDSMHQQVLLTHHLKLEKWLQLGGHADGDLDLAAVAFREAKEESGLTRLELSDTAIFDLDRHRIPARGTEPEHWHYDLRFLIVADPIEKISVSSESKAVEWVELDRVVELNPEQSIQRMVRKTRDLHFKVRRGLGKPLPTD